MATRRGVPLASVIISIDVCCNAVLAFAFVAKHGSGMFMAFRADILCARS